MLEQIRYAPEIPLPPYSYVTGHWPHPLNDPQGHSYSHAANGRGVSEQLAALNRYAVDLWNEGYYWEAHEAWESLWNDAGRAGTSADLFKGLIKLAAAGVKAREGRANGVGRHLQRAEELFASVATFSGDEPLQEYRPIELLELAQELCCAPINPRATEHAPVTIVWSPKIVLYRNPV